MPQQLHQRVVEPSRLIAISGADEFIVEPEFIQESLKTRIVVFAETVMRAERIRDGGQRLTQILGHHFLFGNILRDAAKSIHVIGKSKQFSGDFRHFVEGAPDHAGA